MARKRVASVTTNGQAKKGRPPGSPNRDYIAVAEVPATCRVCGSTNLKQVDGAQVTIQRYGGTCNGHRYDFIRRIPKRCECGQFVMVWSPCQDK